MVVTVLHLSDLHRDPRHPIGNKSLCASLEADRDKYTCEDPPISSPVIVVVSGDLVQGVKEAEDDPSDRLREQYDEASEFLSSVADIFLSGNRDRIVIVPGNHDVSYFHSVRSMQEQHVDAKKKDLRHQYVRQLQRTDSTIRWSWEELTFYKVIDHSVYKRRLETFCEFYKDFYEGRRSYSLDPEEQYDVFDYPDLNICIVGFNSCFNNDPLSRFGNIHPTCIASAATRLRQPQYSPRTKVAVWHHSTQGKPFEFDYMDPDILQVLINYGFCVGLHGHQHRTQYFDQKYEFGGKRKITVISAGTLCGAPNVLPTGEARVYNLIQIDPQDLIGSIHQRRMQNSRFDMPIWGRWVFPSTGGTFVPFLIDPPLFPVSEETERKHILGDAEEHLRRQDPRTAASLLEPIARDNGLARRLLLHCYVELGWQEKIASTYDPPTSSIETIYLMDAMWELQQREKLGKLIKSDAVTASTDPSVRDAARKYEARLNL